jgi:hypothetical protein
MFDSVVQASSTTTAGTPAEIKKQKTKAENDRNQRVTSDPIRPPKRAHICIGFHVDSGIDRFNNELKARD